MSKPILEVELTTLDGKSGKARAVFDTGSHPTIVREDVVPKGATVIRGEEGAVPHEMRTAAQVRIVGATIFVITIGDRMVRDEALISPDLAQDMLIGTHTMQSWDISIQNHEGQTRVVVGCDLRDPDIQEVD